MPRRLELKQRLLRSPCPVDPSTLPRVPGGFGCADCRRTVVDVAGLTLDELVALRRKTASGAERICAAYTLDREKKVRLRAGPGSSAVIAVAIGVLLAACETGSGEVSTHTEHLPRMTPPRTQGLQTLPNGSSAATTGPVPAGPAASGAKQPAPGCAAGHASRPTPKGQGHQAPANDPEMVAGY